MGVKGKPRHSMKRRARRSSYNKKSVTTVNVRGYRIAGQVFSRLLYPNIGEEGLYSINLKDLIPPVDINTIPKTAWKPPDAVAASIIKEDPEPVYDRTTPQNDMKDFAIKGVSIEIFGPVSGKRKGALIAETDTDSSGAFKFYSNMLELDKTYRMIATWKDDKEKVAERIWVKFRVRRKDVRSSVYQRDEVIDIKTTVRHEYFFTERKPDLPPYTYTEYYPKNGHFRQQTWQGASGFEYILKVMLTKPDAGPDVLWFGGPSAILFDTFILRVPYLHQGEDAPHGTNKKVLDNITIRIGSDNWKLPVKVTHMCFVTCLTMVLNYYGFKLKIKDVMKASAIEFFQMNKLIKNFGLSQKDYDDKILKFSAKNGTYPYCRLDILVKVADRFFSKKIKTQRTTPNTPWLGKNVFATGRRRYIDSDNPGSPLDSSIIKKGLALIGAGFPMPLVERGLFDEQWHYELDFRIPRSASDVVAHGVVLSGIILREDGHPQYMIFHDPNDPQNIARWYSENDQYRYSAYMIIGRKMSQKEVNNKALTGGGLLPAPMRQQLP